MHFTLFKLTRLTKQTFLNYLHNIENNIGTCKQMCYRWLLSIDFKLTGSHLFLYVYLDKIHAIRSIRKLSNTNQEMCFLADQKNESFNISDCYRPNNSVASM